MAVVTDQTALALLTESGRILSAALAEVASAVRPGVSTAALDAIAERAIRTRGGEPAFKGYQGFPASLCVSVNDEVVHGIPRVTRILREGDLAGLDLGVRYRGWYTDSAVTVPVGRISPEAERLLTTVRQALASALQVARAGAKTGDIGAAVQTLVEAQGFGVVRDLVGHGIGQRLHEDPTVPNFGRKGTGTLLPEHSVIAIEPMITAGSYRVRVDPDGWTVRTADGSLAAHIEETVIITKHDVYRLTPNGQIART